MRLLNCKKLEPGLYISLPRPRRRVSRPIVYRLLASIINFLKNATPLNHNGKLIRSRQTDRVSGGGGV